MKLLSIISWTIIGGAIGYFIGNVLADLYKEDLTSTGGVIMAKDLQEIKLFPWLLCAVGAFLAGKLSSL